MHRHGRRPYRPSELQQQRRPHDDHGGRLRSLVLRRLRRFPHPEKEGRRLRGL